MAVLAQGSEVYVLAPSAVPGTMEVIKIECATAFNPGGNPAEQIETTCLEDNVRSYLRGLRTPGQASLTINADPRNASHIRLHELAQDDTVEDLAFAVGWSDGTDAPTVDAGGDDFELPTTRTWYVFRGYVADFPFDFASNSVVTSEVSIQRTGPALWVKKAA